MSNQSEDGWYPECLICDGANLGSKVVCKSCYDKVKHQAIQTCLKDELEFLKKFKERNDNQINSRVLNPKITKEDKAYNDGTKDTCKEQNIILKERINQIEQKLKELGK